MTSPAEADNRTDATPHWTLRDCNINLPAILNDPRYGRRDKQFDIFSKTWGESFERVKIYPSAYIKSTEVCKADFKTYLHRIHKYKKHRRGSHTTIESNEDCYNYSVTSIPKIFLESKFDLENADTFNEVFPGVFQQHNNTRKTLQNKLGHFLDIVEVRIASQISQRSQTFFEAMHSQDIIQRNMTETCDSIRLLRADIYKLDTTMVTSPLKLLKLCQCRANLMKMLLKLQMISALQQTQATIQIHLATSEFAGACDLISSAKLELRRNYKGLHCFRYLGPQLQEMHTMIKSMMSQDFCRCIADDLNRLPTVCLDEPSTPSSSSPASTPAPVPVPATTSDTNDSTALNGHSCDSSDATTTTLDSNSDTTLNEDDDDDTTALLCNDFEVNSYEDILSKEKIIAIVTGLIRQRNSDFIASYETEVDLCMKAIFKQVVFDAISQLTEEEEKEEEDSKTNVDRISELDSEQCGTLLHNLFSRLIIVLKRVKYICIRIADIDTVHIEQDVSDTNKVEWENKLIEDLAEMLRNICDKANRESSPIVSKTLDTCTNTTIFIKLSKLIENFSDRSSQLCGQKKSRSPLRSTLQLHVEKYINKFDEIRRNKLSLILNNERWKMADIPHRLQEIANTLQMPDNIVLSKTISEKDEKYEYLTFFDEKFAVSGTSLILLEIVTEYCQCMNDFPCASNSILTKLINLLKLFNSRTCQLILGAGALNSKVLKVISVKNLAITLRCLQLTTAYLPRVRRHFSVDRPSTGRLRRELQRVTSEYDEHIVKLTLKFHALLNTMLANHLVKWEAKAPVPSDSFREIVRQLSRLHNDIFKLWPVNLIQELFKYANECFSTNLLVQLRKLGIKNDGGPQHSLVLTDIRFYVTNVSSLPGLKSMRFNSIDELWQSL